MKKTITILLALALSLSLLAGCSGGASDKPSGTSAPPASSAPPSVSTPPASSTPLPVSTTPASPTPPPISNPMEVVVENSIAFTYSADTCEETILYGDQTAIKAKDGGFTIVFSPNIVSSFYDTSIKNLEDIADKISDYRKEDIKVAGFDAKFVSYTYKAVGKSFTWLVVEFGDTETVGGYKRMHISVTSEKDLASTWSEEVQAIVESLRILSHDDPPPQASNEPPVVSVTPEGMVIWENLSLSLVDGWYVDENRAGYLELYQETTAFDKPNLFIRGYGGSEHMTPNWFVEDLADRYKNHGTVQWAENKNITINGNEYLMAEYTGTDKSYYKMFWLFSMPGTPDEDYDPQNIAYIVLAFDWTVLDDAMSILETVEISWS